MKIKIGIALVAIFTMGFAAGRYLQSKEHRFVILQGESALRMGHDVQVLPDITAVNLVARAAQISRLDKINRSDGSTSYYFGTVVDLTTGVHNAVYFQPAGTGSSGYYPHLNIEAPEGYEADNTWVSWGDHPTEQSVAVGSDECSEALKKLLRDGYITKNGKLWELTEVPPFPKQIGWRGTPRQ